MQDKWGWELPQLSIDTWSGWQQQIEDWRCLCVWWKTNLKTYVFWESFEITVPINNFLSCSLINWTESSIYSLPGKGMLAFSLSVFWNIFNNLTHSFFYLHVAFSKTFENDSVWQPQCCWWWIEILWWLTRGNVCFSTPTFSLASELNLQMKESTKNMTHKLNTFWVEGAF